MSRRTFALALLVLASALCVVAPREAFAACILSGTYKICDSQAEAQSVSAADSYVNNTSTTTEVIQYTAVGPLTYSGGGANNGRQYYGMYNCVGQRTSDTVSCGFNRRTYWWATPLLDCDALNETDPPGPQLFEEGQEPSKCVGAPGGGPGTGCALVATSQTPVESFAGSQGGQATTWNRYEMTYSGDTCDPGAVDDDDYFNEDENQPDRECNVSLGVCVNSDGSTDYCTFNPDGTPSSCVPAQDYDDDGIDDEHDSDPTTPEDMEDDGEGNESDNTSSGGATCKDPPVCKGDGIACATLLQTWRVRCAVAGEGQKLENVSCETEAPLKCTGMALKDCYALFYAKRTACAAGSSTGESGTGTFNPATAAGQGSDPHPTVDAVVEHVGGGDLVAALDEGGITAPDACPALSWPTLELGPVSVPYPGAQLCSWLSVLATVVLLVGYMHASYIVLGR